MNLVDSGGWLEYFADGPNADFFAAPIEDVDNLIVPTLCILEVFKRVIQHRGEAVAFQAVALMQQGSVIDLTVAIALSAAKMGAEIRLPFADSVILATARTSDAIVWTQDADFQGIENVEYIDKK
jgi:predicted nucleic acid-binding protein